MSINTDVPAKDPFADEAFNPIIEAWGARARRDPPPKGRPNAPPVRVPFTFDAPSPQGAAVLLAGLPGTDAQEQLADAREWQNWCLEPRSHYLNWGSPLMNEALQGAQAGTSILIAGMPNHGKSQFLTSTILQLLESNDDVVVLDISLDDSKTKRLTQYAAALSELEMNAIDYAHTLTGRRELFRYDAAVDKLLRWIKDGRLIIYENTTLRAPGRAPVHTASIGYSDK